MLPERFCWTKFGTEAGEPIAAIFQRKERERSSNGGVFLWGIGNSVGPAIAELVRIDAWPVVVFSPMKSKPKAIDVTPGATVRWTTAIDLAGNEWAMPDASLITSRAHSSPGRPKKTHYALVCHSERSLSDAGTAATLRASRLRNFIGGTRLGHSQVTSVVNVADEDAGDAYGYPVHIIARLVYPFFVKLVDPEPIGARAAHSVAASRRTTLPLWP